MIKKAPYKRDGLRRQYNTIHSQHSRYFWNAPNKKIGVNFKSRLELLFCRKHTHVWRLCVNVFFTYLLKQLFDTCKNNSHLTSVGGISAVHVISIYIYFYNGSCVSEGRMPLYGRFASMGRANLLNIRGFQSALALARKRYESWTAFTFWRAHAMRDRLNPHVTCAGP